MDLKNLLKKFGHLALQGLAILSISFFLGEIALRTYHYFTPTFIFYDASYNRFRGKPFSDNWNFKLNSKGFHDEEFTQKTGDTYRIAGLGDSFAFGVVPYENNYLTLLESQLQGENLDVEILNLGIPSIGPDDYLALFVNEGLALKPDMLLLSVFIGNDISDTKARTIQSYSYVASLLSYITTFNTNYEGQIIHSQKIYCDDCPVFDEKTFLAIERARSFIYLEGNQKFLTLLKKTVYYLNQINAICKKKGIEFVIVLIPDELQINPQLQQEVIKRFYPEIKEGTWQTTLPNQKLIAELAERKIDYLDLYQHFAERPTEQLYRPRDSHWNIAGNNLAATIIRDYLLKHYGDHMK